MPAFVYVLFGTVHEFFGDFEICKIDQGNKPGLDAGPKRFSRGKLQCPDKFGDLKILAHLGTLSPGVKLGRRQV